MPACGAPYLLALDIFSFPLVEAPGTKAAHSLTYCYLPESSRKDLFPPHSAFQKQGLIWRMLYAKEYSRLSSVISLKLLQCVALNYDQSHHLMFAELQCDSQIIIIAFHCNSNKNQIPIGLDSRVHKKKTK